VIDSVRFAFTESAFKHGIDKETILGVVADPIFSKIDSEQVNIFQIGFDSQGNTIEIAYDIGTRTIFHAMRVRKLGKKTK
jgi:hypothetical protein